MDGIPKLPTNCVKAVNNYYPVVVRIDISVNRAKTLTLIITVNSSGGSRW